MAPTVFCESFKALLFVAVVLLLSVGGGSAANDTLEGQHFRTVTVFEGEDLTVICRAPPHFSYWTNKKGFYRSGPRLCVKNITSNYTGFYYCFKKTIHLNHLEDFVYVKVKAAKQYTPVEGQIFIIKAPTLSHSAFWTNKRGYYKSGSTLYFFSINRRYTGWFYCYKKGPHGKDLVQKVYIDVQYPPKILSVSSDDSPLDENQTFSLSLSVEGHPDPTTTFASEFNGNVVFKKSGQGTFSITVEEVQCENGGHYMLKTENDIGRDTRNEKILVYCPPAPRTGVKNKFEPRLGDDVALKVQAMGYPYPTFTWTLDGEVIANSTGEDEDEFDINSVTIDDFGIYELTMTNEFGSSSENFSVTADGPPEPVTDLSVKSVTEDSVDIGFVSGYDYEEWQTFTVLVHNGEDYIELETFKDIARSHKPTTESHVIKGLEPGMTYNVTIVSNNSRGESNMPTQFVTFTTKAPNTVIEILEGENLTQTCEASNMTDVHWEDASHKRISSDDVLEFADINREESGTYTCVGMSDTNKKHIVEEITVDVQYPAKILNMTVEDNYLEANDTFVMELIVEGNPQPKNTFIQVLDGEVGFDQTGAGTFNVTMEYMKCSDQGVYNLTVSNKVGTDILRPVIYVYCPPVVNKRRNIKTKFYPRIGQTESLVIENYAYPYPSYTWWHEGKKLGHHEDSDFTSKLTMDVVMNDFGNYFVDVENDRGLLDFSFQVIPSGVPGPVTNITIESATYDSVKLAWFSGYNYGSQQTFTILQEQNGQYIGIENVTDTSENGTEWFEHEITGLAGLTEYNFTVRAFNENGYSEAEPSEFVQVTTSDDPEAQKGDDLDDGEIAGIVIGGAAFVGILLVVGVFLFRRGKRRTEYQEIIGE